VIVGVVTIFITGRYNRNNSTGLYHFADDFRFFSLEIHSRDIPAPWLSLKRNGSNWIADSFNSFFVDEAFDKQYKAEDRFGKLFMYFSLFAIFISSLGLLGLAAYSTLQRTRRSVSGRYWDRRCRDVALLARDFLKLVIFAFIIASR